MFEKQTKLQPTKRNLLSEIYKLLVYDLLGWLAAITISAKILFQKVWTSQLTWDEDLSTDIQEEWLKLRTELSAINAISVNGWLGGTQRNIELLGFCDAREKAYLCVMYTRVTNKNGDPTTTLLAAKARVAPLAQKTFNDINTKIGTLRRTTAVATSYKSNRSVQSVWHHYSHLERRPSSDRNHRRQRHPPESGALARDQLLKTTLRLILTIFFLYTVISLPWQSI